jgi:hypothetical protein
MDTRVLSLSICSLFLAIHAQAASPACQALVDASRKLRSVPVHIYGTRSAALTGKPGSSEIIYWKGRVFVKGRGAWTSYPAPWLSQSEKDASAEELKIKNTCEVVREEPVNGEPSIVYKTRSDGGDTGTVESVNWVSKTRGLVLKTEIDTAVGGRAGNLHQTLRYDYTNVQPPQGVQ